MKLLSHIIALTLPDTTPLQVSTALDLVVVYLQKQINKLPVKKHKDPCLGQAPCM